MGGSLTVDRVFAFIGVRDLTPEQMELLRQEQARKQHGKALKAAGEQNKKDRKQITAEVDYNDRRQRSEEALRELQGGLPVTAKLVSDIIDAHLAADGILSKTPKDYVAAGEALRKVSVSDFLKNGQTLVEAAGKKARSTYKDAFREAGAIKLRLTGAASLLTREAAEQIDSAVDGQTSRLVTPKFDQNVDAAVRAALKKIDGDVTTQNNAAATKQAEVGRRGPLAEAEVGRLQAILTDTQHAALARQYAGLATLVSDKDFVAAIDLLDAFDAASYKAEAAATPGMDDWERGKDDLPRLATVARDMAGSASTAVAERAAKLAENLTALRKETPGKTVTYVIALARLRECQSQAVVLAGLDRKYGVFAGKDLPDGVRQVGDAEKLVLSQFGVLAQAVKAVAPNAKGGTGESGFRAQFDGIKAAFEKRRTTAVDTDGLDADGAVSKLTDLARAIGVAAANPTALANLIGDDTLAEARRGYDTARRTAMVAIDRLRGLVAADGNAAVAGVASFDQKADVAIRASQVVTLAAQVTALGVAAGKQAAVLDKGRQKRQESLNDDANKIAVLLQTLAVAVDGIKNEKRQQDYRTLHATLSTELAQQRAMVGLAQISLLDAAQPELAKLRSDVELALAAANGGKNPDGDQVPTLEGVQQRTALLKKQLDKTEVKAFKGASAFQATQELIEIEKAIGADPIMDLLGKLWKMSAKVAAITAGAVKAREVYDAFKTDLQGIREKMKGDIFKQAPKYTAYLNGELDAARAQARTEDGMAAAKQDALRISGEIDAYLQDNDRDSRGVPKALATREGEALADVEKQKQDAARWAGAYDVASRELDRQSGIDSAELGNLRKILSTADTDFKKSGDFDAAMARIKAARDRLALLQANPDGLELSSRNRLPKVNQGWKDAVGLLKDGLDGTASAAAGLVKSADLDGAGETAVKNTLASVRALFNAGAFDGPIAAMTAANETKEKRSGAREVALRDLRRFRAYLNDDYRLLELARNPFVQGMNATVARLNSALADLENNMMASL